MIPTIADIDMAMAGAMEVEEEDTRTKLTGASTEMWKSIGIITQVGNLWRMHDIDVLRKKKIDMKEYQEDSSPNRKRNIRKLREKAEGEIQEFTAITSGSDMEVSLPLIIVIRIDRSNMSAEMVLERWRRRTKMMKMKMKKKMKMMIKKTKR